MAHPSANEDFSEMVRGDLVDYLALRGLSTSGRKMELVALACIKHPNNLHRRGYKYKTEKGVYRKAQKTTLERIPSMCQETALQMM